MKIRGRQIKQRGGLYKGTLVAGVIVLTLIVNTKVAQADPHGMFYTAIGQQQLFFNVLAALDQADYVETAFDREARRQAREAVTAQQPFSKETESGGRFTGETEIELDSQPESQSQGSAQPGTPALLNRNVTLEGADLYTDQLVREFGAESARRNAAAELLQTLCAYGFGFEECDYDLSGKTTEEQATIEQQRRRAVVVDPLEWQSMPFVYGVLPALNSGTEADEMERQRRMLNPERYNTPYAYSAQMDFWRKQIQGLPDAQLQQQYLNKLAGSVIASMSPASRIVAWPFAALEANANNPGEYNYRNIEMKNKDNCWPVGASPPCLSYAWGRNSGYNSAPEYIDDVDSQAMAALSTINRIAQDAARTVASQQALIEDQGLLADTKLMPKPAQITYGAGVVPVALSAIGEIYWHVNNPVAARTASVYGIPNVLGQLATSQQASSLTGLDQPGGTQLVKRGGSQGSQQPQCSNGIDDDGDGYVDFPSDPECDSPTDPSEAGTQGANSGTGPQVAGALDLLFKPSDNFFDEEKSPTSPSANIISPILEFGARHALRVMTAGKWRPATTAGITCGYTCE